MGSITWRVILHTPATVQKEMGNFILQNNFQLDSSSSGIWGIKTERNDPVKKKLT